MKNNMIWIGLLVAVLLLGIVYAQGDPPTITTQPDNSHGQERPDANAANDTSAKDMTYGQCVSKNAEIKNSCYSSVKSALETCKANAAQDATKKDALNQCSKIYKSDKSQCKTVFKDSKKECAKIKHNFLETIGSAFK